MKSYLEGKSLWSNFSLFNFDKWNETYKDLSLTVILDCPLKLVLDYSVTEINSAHLKIYDTFPYFTKSVIDWQHTLYLLTQSYLNIIATNS